MERSSSVDALATSFGEGDTYGGYLRTTNTGTGDHYGVVGLGYNDDSSPSFGVYGHAENSGDYSAPAYGGYFSATSGSSQGGCAAVFAAGTSPTWAGFFSVKVYVSESEHIEGSLNVVGSKNEAVKIDN